MKWWFVLKKNAMTSIPVRWEGRQSYLILLAVGALNISTTEMKHTYAKLEIRARSWKEHANLGRMRKTARTRVPGKYRQYIQIVRHGMYVCIQIRQFPRCLASSEFLIDVCSAKRICRVIVVTHGKAITFSLFGCQSIHLHALFFIRTKRTEGLTRAQDNLS